MQDQSPKRSGRSITPFPSFGLDGEFSTVVDLRGLRHLFFEQAHVGCWVGWLVLPATSSPAVETTFLSPCSVPRFMSRTVHTGTDENAVRRTRKLAEKNWSARPVGDFWW